MVRQESHERSVEDHLLCVEMHRGHSFSTNSATTKANPTDRDLQRTKTTLTKESPKVRVNEQTCIESIVGEEHFVCHAY